MLATLILVAGLAAPGVSASGNIDAPEGFRARLPAGFRYAADAQDGHTYYRAADPAGAALVSVAKGPVEAATRCDATGEVEAQPGVRTRVSPLRTRAGLTGCIVRGQNDQGGLALVVLPAPDGEVLVVAGVARGRDRAEQLARGVAESVSFPPAPKVDPRLVGCFAREASRTGDMGIANYFTLTKRVERCFFADHRYRSIVEVFTTGAATRQVSGDPNEGTWSYRNGTLEVRADETWRARVGFEEGDLILDGDRWQRQREPAPAPEDDEAGEDG